MYMDSLITVYYTIKFKNIIYVFSYNKIFMSFVIILSIIQNLSQHVTDKGQLVCFETTSLAFSAQPLSDK